MKSISEADTFTPLFPHRHLTSCYVAGLIFWLIWKKLRGSYLVLICPRRVAFVDEARWFGILLSRSSALSKLFGNLCWGKHPYFCCCQFNWYGWREQISALAEADCRVIVPDQRGYNLSDKPQGVKAYCIDTLVEDIVGLVNALDYEKVNLVGHDWGGIVAWSLANKHPERLHRLGILNAPHPLIMRRFLQRDFEQMRRSLYAFFFQLPWLPEKLMSADHWRGAVRALRGSGKIHTFTNEDIKKYKEAWSQPGAMTAMLNWYRAAARYQGWITEDMRVHIPTLILWGAKDAALSHRIARPSLDYCDDGNLIFFPDATHWVQHEEAEEVNRHLLEFVFT